MDYEVEAIVNAGIWTPLDAHIRLVKEIGYEELTLIAGLIDVIVLRKMQERLEMSKHWTRKRAAILMEIEYWNAVGELYDLAVLMCDKTRA